MTLQHEIKADKASHLQIDETLANEAALLIKRAVSLDVLPWLDLDLIGLSQENQFAIDIHRHLLNTLNQSITHGVDEEEPTGSRKSEKLSVDADRKLSHETDRIRTFFIPVINACTFDVLEKTLNSISQISHSKVIYRVHISEGSGIRENDFDWDFNQIPGIGIGDPVTAFENMIALRNKDSLQQWEALELLLAKRQLRMAPITLDISQQYHPSSVPWDQRKLRSATKKVEQLQSKVRADVLEMVEETLKCFQSQESGIFPLAVALPETATEMTFLTLASAYQNLSKEVRIPFDWVIKGLPSECLKVSNDWQKYLACGRAFKVIAAWLRSLGNLNRDNKRCQYCYRHRATKLRCLEHGSAINESPSARRGRAIFPIYLDTLSTITAYENVRQALAESLIVNIDEWQQVLNEVISDGIPLVLHRSAAILVVQLRRVRVILGVKFEDDARCLFSKMVMVATEAINMKNETGDGAKRNADDAPYLLSIRNFMKLWCARSSHMLGENFQEILALGYDPYHPVLQSTSFFNVDIANDFLLQRAWYEAENEFTKATTINREMVMQLRYGEMPLSLRDIGKVLGCSHETVRRLLAEKSKPKYQRLKSIKGFT